MKIFKLILAGVIGMVLVFCYGWICWHGGQNIKPTRTPVSIPIVNSQPDNNSPNQVMVNISGYGKTETSSAKTKSESKVISKPTLKTNIVAPLNRTLPFEGQITAKFVNKKDNTDLGDQTQPFTGNVTISGDSSDFEISFDFVSQVTFGINIPEEPKKCWHVGFYLASDFDEISLGGYGQKDFELMTIRNKLDILGFVRVEFDYDQRIMSGIELNF